MRVAYLDCLGGVSGDMFLGALLDAGWPEERLRASVAWLGAEIAQLRVETRMRGGFRGLGIVVAPAGRGEHDHRGLADVLALLAGAPLAPDIRGRAEAVFRRLAEAEARAHGSTSAEIRFHEVGAVDALVDVVGVVTALAELEIEHLHFSPLPLGSGQVPSAHGPIPLPAPATAILLEGTAVEFTGRAGERTTPTGAALVTTLGRCAPPPPMLLERVGTGAGSFSYPDRPNIARLFLGRESASAAPGVPASLTDLPSWGWSPEAGPEAGVDSAAGERCPGFWERVAVLETQIDDATAEEIADLCERLRRSGALEVFIESLNMKKGRPGVALTVLCRPEEEERLAARLLLDSPTLGVRRRVEWRRELERRCVEVATRFGPLRVKLARRGARWSAKPEYESVRRAAEASGTPFSEVFRAGLEAALALAAGTPQPQEPGEPE